MNAKYKSSTQRAWRNLMVCAINAGLRLGKFSLDPSDLRAPLADGELYDFQLPGGIPARACVRQIAYGELRVSVAAQPQGDLVRTVNAGLQAGDAFAIGWLEREAGAWLQFSDKGAACKRGLLTTLSQMDVNPEGYADCGAFVF